MHVIFTAFVAQGIREDAQDCRAIGICDAGCFSGHNKPLVFFRRCQPHANHGSAHRAALLVIDAGRYVYKRQTHVDYLL